MSAVSVRLFKHYASSPSLVSVDPKSK